MLQSFASMIGLLVCSFLFWQFFWLDLVWGKCWSPKRSGCVFSLLSFFWKNWYGISIILSVFCRICLQSHLDLEFSLSEGFYVQIWFILKNTLTVHIPQEIDPFHPKDWNLQTWWLFTVFPYYHFKSVSTMTMFPLSFLIFATSVLFLFPPGSVWMEYFHFVDVLPQESAFSSIDFSLVFSALNYRFLCFIISFLLLAVGSVLVFLLLYFLQVKVSIVDLSSFVFSNINIQSVSSD